MNEVTIDIEQRGTIVIAAHLVRIPNLVVERLCCHVGFSCCVVEGTDFSAFFDSAANSTGDLNIIEPLLARCRANVRLAPRAFSVCGSSLAIAQSASGADAGMRGATASTS